MNTSKYSGICKTTENKWEISRQSVRHFGKVKSQPYKTLEPNRIYQLKLLGTNEWVESTPCMFVQCYLKCDNV